MGEKRNPLYTTNVDEIFPRKISKSQKTRMKIIEAAIDCFAKHGIESSSLEQIAKRCDVSRQLILKYFENKKKLTEVTITFVRARFQQIAVAAIQSAKGPQAQLRAYIASTFKWIEEYEKDSSIWVLVYYYSTVDKEVRAINTKLVSVGHTRITAMVTALTPKISPKEAEHRAKLMQMVLTGGLLSLVTEDPIPSRAELKAEISQTIESIALHGTPK